MSRLVAQRLQLTHHTIATIHIVVKLVAGFAKALAHLVFRPFDDAVDIRDRVRIAYAAQADVPFTDLARSLEFHAHDVRRHEARPGDARRFFTELLVAAVRHIEHAALPNLLPQHRAGKIKVLGITDSKRSAIASDIPAIAETVPGFEFRNWFGLIVATGTPPSIVRQINTDVNKLLNSADTRQRLIDQGFDVLGGTQEEFAHIITTDTVKFAKIIRDTAIK